MATTNKVDCCLYGVIWQEDRYVTVTHQLGTMLWDYWSGRPRVGEQSDAQVQIEYQHVDEVYVVTAPHYFVWYDTFAEAHVDALERCAEVQH